MVRLPVVNGVAMTLNAVFLATLVHNTAAHIMLGGFVWSGAALFWGIIVSVITAIFLGRRPGTIMAGCYIVAAIVFTFLKPTLQARRSQPALAVSVGVVADVFIISLLILVPVVIVLMSQIVSERARSGRLLLNVLPGAIAERLKRSSGVIADAYESCTVMFADIVGFTDHSARMCELALRMREAMPTINEELGSAFQLRIGLDTGRLVAGVVGSSRFSFDLWGDTVNLASRWKP